MIVSNPPYIAEEDPHLLVGDLRFEPRMALVSGLDGLTAISDIIRQSRRFLNPSGALWLEHGYNQAASVRELLHRAGFSNICSAHDLSGIERVTGGTSLFTNSEERV